MLTIFSTKKSFDSIETWKNNIYNAISKTKNIIFLTLKCLTAYNLFDRGLAYFLALETLNHGTNPFSYLSISLRGADPKMGGTGSSTFADRFTKESKGQFHVMPDLGFCRRKDPIAQITYKFGSMLGPFVYSNLFIPKFFGGLSTMGWLGKSGKSRSVSQLLLPALLAGLFTQTLKFRFQPKEIQNRFAIDPFVEAALKTSHRITPLRLGICGSLAIGISKDMFQRMMANPWKVVSGALLIGAGVGLAINTYREWKKQQEEKPTTAPVKIDSSQSSIVHRISKASSWAISSVANVAKATLYCTLSIL